MAASVDFLARSTWAGLSFDQTSQMWMQYVGTNALGDRCPKIAPAIFQYPGVGPLRGMRAEADISAGEVRKIRMSSPL